MTPSIESIFKQFCDESGCQFRQIDQEYFVTQYSGQHAVWPVFVHIRDTTLCFASVLPFTVPDGRKFEILAYLNYVNCRMLSCTFDMNPNGEIRFRTSLDYVDGTLTLKTIGALLYLNVLNFEHYLPGLLCILFANASLQDAIQAIATPDDDEESDADDLNELLHDVDLDQLPDQGDD